MELPESFYVPERRVPARRIMRLWVYAALVVVCGWHLFHLPGSLLQPFRLPEDVPAFGFGLKGVFVKPDGSWVVRRGYYADRMERYEYAPDGTLVSRERDAGMAREDDISGSLRAASVFMENGHTLKVRPSRGYFRELRSLRDAALERRPELESALAPEAEPPPELAGWDDPYVIVQTYRDKAGIHPVLPGHQYFEVLDSGSFHAPSLWLTTDRLGHLHRIRASDAAGDPSITVERTVALDIEDPPQFDSALGLDSSRGELYLLLADGRRFWFDPETLEARGSDRLAGVWEREYGQLDPLARAARKEFPSYSLDSGWPLSESAYLRLMRVLLLVFLGALLGLLMEGRATWRSTSAQTTAATS